jgi:hypothetical protein
MQRIMQRHHLKRHSRQRGQAMVFATVTMVIILIALLMMYNTGKLTTEKMKLQNTADAVAYSAAVVEARDLNFAAYMNRGMIANQVAVAQIVSVTGWVRNLDDTYNGKLAWLPDFFANMSPLSFMWTIPKKIIAGVSKVLKPILDAAGPVMVKVLDGLIDVLHVASKTYHLGSIETLISTTHDVLDANDKQASVSPSGLLLASYSTYNHIKFIKEFDPTAAVDPKKGGGDGDERFAKVVDASTDLFYKNRDLPALTLWPLPFLFDPTRLFNPGLGPLLMLQFHAGGSTMRSSDHKSYVSADATGSFIIMILNINILGIPIPIPFPLILPEGGGAAAAGTFQNEVLAEVGLGYVQHRNGSNTGMDLAAGVDYGIAYAHPFTAMNYWMKAGEGPGKNMDTRAGLRKYYDVAKNVDSKTGASTQVTRSLIMQKTENGNDTGPLFTIEIERDGDSFGTSESPTFNIGGGADGDLYLENKAVAKKMRAMSSAQAYFWRDTALSPRTAAFFGQVEKAEFGSLYSPYWQAHLAPEMEIPGLKLLNSFGVPVPILQPLRVLSNIAQMEQSLIPDLP